MRKKAGRFSLGRRTMRRMSSTCTQPRAARSSRCKRICVPEENAKSANSADAALNFPEPSTFVRKLATAPFGFVSQPSQSPPSNLPPRMQPLSCPAVFNEACATSSPPWVFLYCVGVNLLGISDGTQGAQTCAPSPRRKTLSSTLLVVQSAWYVAFALPVSTALPSAVRNSNHLA